MSEQERFLAVPAVTPADDLGRRILRDGDARKETRTGIRPTALVEIEGAMVEREHFGTDVRPVLYLTGRVRALRGAGLPDDVGAVTLDDADHRGTAVRVRYELTDAQVMRTTLRGMGREDWPGLSAALLGRGERKMTFMVPVAADLTVARAEGMDAPLLVVDVRDRAQIETDWQSCGVDFVAQWQAAPSAVADWTIDVLRRQDALLVAADRDMMARARMRGMAPKSEPEAPTRYENRVFESIFDGMDLGSDVEHEQERAREDAPAATEAPDAVHEAPEAEGDEAAGAAGSADDAADRVLAERAAELAEARRASEERARQMAEAERAAREAEASHSLLEELGFDEDDDEAEGAHGEKSRRTEGMARSAAAIDAADGDGVFTSVYNEEMAEASGRAKVDDGPDF